MQNSNSPIDLLSVLLRLAAGAVIVTCLMLIYFAFGDKLAGLSKRGPVPELPAGFEYSGQYDVDSSGVHLATGLMYGPGIFVVQKHCLACHSSTLVTQSRATREGWQQTIRWMQQTQGLWDLGADEGTVLDYLAKYYAPEEQGRRPILDPDEIEWYVLENNDQ